MELQDESSSVEPSLFIVQVHSLLVEAFGVHIERVVMSLLAVSYAALFCKDSQFPRKVSLHSHPGHGHE